jgi:hypothetical protein
MERTRSGLTFRRLDFPPENGTSLAPGITGGTSSLPTRTATRYLAVLRLSNARHTQVKGRSFYCCQIVDRRAALKRASMRSGGRTGGKDSSQRTSLTTWTSAGSLLTRMSAAPTGTMTLTATTGSPVAAESSLAARRASKRLLRT